VSELATHHCLVQWCIAKNGGGYTQTGVAKGLKVPCLFMIAEVSIRCQKNPGGWYTPYNRVYTPPIHHWPCPLFSLEITENHYIYVDCLSLFPILLTLSPASPYQHSHNVSVTVIETTVSEGPIKYMYISDTVNYIIFCSHVIH